MSDHIAHLAACDDVFRLAPLHAGMHPHLVKLMGTHREAAHMGSVTRYADKWSADVIDWTRQENAKPEGDRRPHTDDRLAFVLGSLTHRSADRHTKPITRCWGTGDDDSGDAKSLANESKIIQDLFILKEVYGEGLPAAATDVDDAAAGPMAGALGQALLHVPSDEYQRQLETYFRVLLRRALIAMHTIRPDPDHIHGWFDGFFDALQTYPKRIAQYAELAAAWDSDKVRKYLVETDFYDGEDALIVLTRRVQRGHRATPDDCAAAFDATTDNSSRWARLIKRALEYLEAASRLYAGELSVADAKTAFDVGVPELSLG